MDSIGPSYKLETRKTAELQNYSKIAIRKFLRFKQKFAMETSQRPKEHMRLAVIGTSGTGKSTLAKSVAQKFKLKYIEQDRFYWLPGWLVAPKEQFITSVLKEVSEESWVICGNYSSVQEEVWKRATHLIWLNFPLRIALARGIQRTFKRIFQDLECCNGNYEKLRRVFWPNDSILWYILKSHSKLQTHYHTSKVNGKFDHLTFIEFTSPAQAEKWLKSL